MLTEKRQDEILQLLEVRGSVTVQELTEKFGASESTIRRDLAVMDRRGVLTKVFGGAMRLETTNSVKEELVARRREINTEEKLRIGALAASLIEENDFIYLDAGTTTAAMIPYITVKTAVFVTNAVSHALELTQKGFRVIIIGGELKSATEAIVGTSAYESLLKYNFNKGFFGTNGVDRKAGFTTPDLNESVIKQCAMQHCQKKYVLATQNKFRQINPVQFGTFESATIITDALPDESYRGASNILLAE